MVNAMKDAMVYIMIDVMVDAMIDAMVGAMVDACYHSLKGPPTFFWGGGALLITMVETAPYCCATYLGIIERSL